MACFALVVLFIIQAHTADVQVCLISKRKLSVLWYKSPDITQNISLKGIIHTEFCHPNVVPERYDFFLLLKEMFCRLFFILISMQQQ